MSPGGTEASCHAYSSGEGEPTSQGHPHQEEQKRWYCPFFTYIVNPASWLGYKLPSGCDLDGILGKNMNVGLASVRLYIRLTCFFLTVLVYFDGARGPISAWFTFPCLVPHSLSRHFLEERSFHSLQFLFYSDAFLSFFRIM